MGEGEDGFKVWVIVAFRTDELVGQGTVLPSQRAEMPNCVST
jgi:hypothetical protein